ncbi:ferredoxin-NADP reductase [Fragilaria crotonensis]|nr:ferredoxin-NADP reductase [Fragilaria crotonensis]
MMHRIAIVVASLVLLGADGFTTYSPSQRSRNAVTLQASPLQLNRSILGLKTSRAKNHGNSLSPSAKTNPTRQIAITVLKNVATSFFMLALLHTPAALAAKKSTVVVEHLHTGQKIANFFRSFGLPDVAVLALISALPVVELRGAIPVGIWMGLPITTVLPACVFGNMLPIIPILYLLRNERLKKLMAPILDRAEKKSASLGVGSLQKQWVSLAAFVGVPLPGTGAWTGAMGTYYVRNYLGWQERGGIAALAVLFAFTAKELLFGEKKQDFLEASPYWDQTDVPVNVYKNKEPFIGKVISTKRIVGPQATGETCHIIIDHKGKFPYWEGQSWGVIPPGTREKDGKLHSVRLYSIASSRYGDDMTGKTGSLCVRRATYWCPELKADDPAKKGICSNFLCDTMPGDEVQMTGPAGKVMLLPEEDPNTDYIMVATGTGIAPYRGFVRRLFVESTPAAAAYKGQAWLFLGVANSDALLYDDEWQSVKAAHPDQFRLDYALSREQENKKGRQDVHSGQS